MARRTWYQKFADAFRGAAIGVQGQSSFAVHVAAAIAVFIAGLVLGLSGVEWCLLVLCVTIVLTVELINSVLERIAVIITSAYDPRIRDALDMASAAVLCAALGSVVIGLIIFLPKLLVLGGCSSTFLP